MDITCHSCQKSFSKRSNLNRHIREVHNLSTSAIAYEKEVWNYKCFESNCNTSFQKSKGLIDHLQQKHNKHFEIEEIKLISQDEFESWKSKIEFDYKCRYVTSTTHHNNNTGETITYYYCSRSKCGKPPPNKGRRRRLKAQGSCKLDFCCPSQIKLIEEGLGSDKVLTVIWKKTHYGHTMDLQHLRLQKVEREKVAKQLINGLTPTKILDQTQDKVDEELQRIHLLTNTDVLNIKKEYKIEISKEKNEEIKAIPIDQWVKECKSKPPEENPVLFYKKQGTISPLLDENEFCLIVMNHLQQLMLKKFGNNIIVVENTDELNNYNFNLTVLMIMDEFSEIFPTTFMFSNTKNTKIYQILFDTLKTRVGTIDTETFMCDTPETFYGAWSSCMGPATYVTEINTGSTRKTANYFYLDLKKPKNIDKELQAALKFVREKSRNRVMKLVKGKNVFYNRDVLKRHMFALNSQFNVEIVNVLGENCWKVGNNTRVYLVRKLLADSCCNLICSECKICFHMYTCNCRDFLRTSKICKHIHYVHKFDGETSENFDRVGTCGNEKVEMSEMNDENSTENWFAETQNEQLKESFKHKINTILEKLQSMDSESLNDSVIFQILQHLDIINKLLDSHSGVKVPSLTRNTIEKNLFINKRKLDDKMWDKCSKNQKKCGVGSILNDSVLFVSNNSNNYDNS